LISTSFDRRSSASLVAGVVVGPDADKEVVMQPKAGLTAAAVPRDPNDITPADSPLRCADVMASPTIERIRTPCLGIGDVAHDFSSPELDLSGGAARPTGRTFHLAAHAGLRPVSLIFGSYT
jgi:hypothetical protein